MINDDLVGGLKSALERGEPLKKAMMSLFNSGYKKEEIEEAARNLNSFPVVGTFQQKKEIPAKEEVKIKKEIPAKETKIKNPIIPEKKPVKIQAYPQLQASPQVQKVSNYGKPVDDKTVITILTIILIFLLSTLAVILIFKNELINFFNTMLA